MYSAFNMAEIRSFSLGQLSQKTEMRYLSVPSTHNNAVLLFLKSLHILIVTVAE